MHVVAISGVLLGRGKEGGEPIPSASAGMTPHQVIQQYVLAHSDELNYAGDLDAFLVG